MSKEEMIKAGRVAIVPKGDFVLGTQYTKLDLVTYEGSAYVAKKDNISILPTDEDTWMLMVSNGGLDKSNFLGNETGYTYPNKNGGNADDYVFEYHGFVFNMSKTPEAYGFLDVSWFDGKGFAPATSGVVRQIFTGYNTGKTYFRTKVGSSDWGDWMSYAKNAEQDCEGNNIVDTYMPKSGGTFTGNVKIASGLNNIGLEVNTTAKNMSSYSAVLRTSGIGILNLSGYHNGEPYVTLCLDTGAFYETLTDGVLSLGISGSRWDQVYAKNAAISTSDRKEKNDISYIGEESDYDTNMSDELLTDFIMGLKPVVFKRSNGESGRPHHGLIAQDVEEILNKLGIDHAAFIKSPVTKQVEVYEVDGREVLRRDVGSEDKNEAIQKLLETYGEAVSIRYEEEVIPGEFRYGMRYEELTGDNIRFSQILKTTVDSLVETVRSQENEIESLREELREIKQMLLN